MDFEKYKNKIPYPTKPHRSILDSKATPNDKMIEKKLKEE